MQKMESKHSFKSKTNFSSYEIYMLPPIGQKAIEKNISCKND